MKIKSLLLILFALAPVLGMAQTKPSGKTSPGLSVTPARSTTTANTNRQQELYDQYHGATPRPTPTPTPTSGSMSRTQPDKPAQPDRNARTTQPAKPETAAPASGDDSPAGIRIGLRGGVTYPVYLEELIGIDPAIGFTGGIVFQFGSGGIAFQPEINYTRYGVKGVFDDGLGNRISVTGAADQVEIPLLLKIATGDASSTRFFINVGPYASYLLSTSTNGKTESLDGVEGRFGFGAAAGIGAAIKVGPGHVTVEVRGLYSLGDIDNGFSTDSKTIATQATIGYLIPLGGR